MSHTKCSQCGLINLSSDELCERCGAPLGNGDMPLGEVEMTLGKGNMPLGNGNMPLGKGNMPLGLAAA